MQDTLVYSTTTEEVKLQIYRTPSNDLWIWLQVGVAGVRIKPEQLEDVFEGILILHEILEELEEEENE